MSELAPTKLRCIVIALGFFFHRVTVCSQSPLISTLVYLGTKKPIGATPSVNVLFVSNFYFNMKNGQLLNANMLPIQYKNM
jgi:hypothetical protein